MRKFIPSTIAISINQGNGVQLARALFLMLGWAFRALAASADFHDFLRTLLYSPQLACPLALYVALSSNTLSVRHYHKLSFNGADGSFIPFHSPFTHSSIFQVVA